MSWGMEPFIGPYWIKTYLRLDAVIYLGWDALIPSYPEGEKGRGNPPTQRTKLRLRPQPTLRPAYLKWIQRAPVLRHQSISASATGGVNRSSRPPTSPPAHCRRRRQSGWGSARNSPQVSPRARRLARQTDRLVGVPLFLRACACEGGWARGCVNSK
jgi:hypothetical protein